MNKRILLILLISLSILAAGQAQTPQAQGQPVPEELAQGAQPLSQVELLTMPPLDATGLLADTQRRLNAGLPLRFAYAFQVEHSPVSAGTWERLDGDRLLWRLRIASPGALSLNLGFSRYAVPPGAELFLYTPDYSTIIGPFTHQDNEQHGELWTPMLPGDEIVVELSLPASSQEPFGLELGSINHGYVDPGNPAQVLSGACNLDVVCGAGDGYPQVDPWRDPIRSAGAYTVGGIDTCSGALINNTAQDLTPYFLTADHCGISAGNAASVVVYWNYENSWCRPPGSPASSDPGDGQRNQFNSGAIFRAGYAASDFTLIEMDDPIDPDFNPHWAGWDRRDIAPVSAVTIHHPSVEEKRISFEDDPTSITDYLSNTPNPNGTHIRIADWDLGTTEPGSSGSPLFSPEYRIIGDLTGGYAACGNDEPDWYGRLHVSWDGGGSSSTRLSDWLDPLNTGAPFMNGRDYIEAPFELQVTPLERAICAPTDATYHITVTQATPGFIDPVTLNALGVPSNTTAIFSTNPVIPTGTSVLSITNTGAASTGRYDIDVVAVAATHTLTSTVRLDLYTGIPNLTSLITPADGALDQALAPDFGWSDIPSAASYNWELDASPFFDPPLFSANDLLEASHTLTSPLQERRCFWWRVQADNTCGLGAWTAPFHFATALLGVSFFDDLESGDGNWSHQADQGIDNWALSTAQSHSPSHAWHVPDDPNITDSYLWNTAPVAIGGGSRLTFWHRHEFEASYDGGVLEISTDGGSTWTDLGPHITANGYNGTLSTAYSNPLGGRQAWVSDLTTWTQVEVDLSSFAGQNVNVRWRIGCDSSVSDVGWYIDDIEITAPLPPAPAPTLASVTPSSGSPFSPTPVQIEGSGFIATPNARLGQTWLLSMTQVNSTTLTGVVPAGMAPGTYDLVLYNGDCQQASLSDAFTVFSDCVDLTAVNVAGPTGGFPGIYTFTTSTQPPSATLPIAYLWDDGGTAETSVRNLDVGTHTLTLTATNCFSAVVSDSHTVVVVAPDVTVSRPAVDERLGLGESYTQTLTLTNQGTADLDWSLIETPAVGWLSESPVSGTLGVQAELDISVRFEAGELAVGLYTTSLQLHSNDPDEPDINRPVTLTVVCTPVTGVDLSLASGTPLHPGDPAWFSADLSPGDAAKPYSYTVDYGDGVSETLSASADPLALQHTFAATGSYTVELAAWNCGMSQPVTDALTVTISAGPVCTQVESLDVILVTTSSLYPDEPVAFSADVAPDEATKPYSYTVNYGDGLTETQGSSADPLVLEHTYAASGTYRVELAAWNCGMSQPVTDALEIEVSARPTCVEVETVVLRLLGSGSLYLGDVAQFSADLGPDDAAKPYTYTVDYGDGSVLIPVAASDDPLTFSHTYAASGTYTVEFAAWNCAMTQPVTGHVQVNVSAEGAGYTLYLPIVIRNG